MRHAISGLTLVLSLLAGGAALGGEAITIALPDSDVVTSSKPYVAVVTVEEQLAKAGVSALVELRRAEAGLNNAAPFSASVRLATAAAEGAVAGEVVIDAGNLAEGEYTGSITVTAGEQKRSAALTMFRLPDERPADFPYGTYAVPFHFENDPKTRKRVPNKQQHIQVMKEMKAAGINLIQLHMAGIGEWGCIEPDEGAPG